MAPSAGWLLDPEDCRFHLETGILGLYGTILRGRQGDLMAPGALEGFRVRSKPAMALPAGNP